MALKGIAVKILAIAVKTVKLGLFFALICVICFIKVAKPQTNSDRSNIMTAVCRI